MKSAHPWNEWQRSPRVIVRARTKTKILEKVELKRREGYEPVGAEYVEDYSAWGDQRYVSVLQLKQKEDAST